MPQYKNEIYFHNYFKKYTEIRYQTWSGGKQFLKNIVQSILYYLKDLETSPRFLSIFLKPL